MPSVFCSRCFPQSISPAIEAGNSLQHVDLQQLQHRATQGCKWRLQALQCQIALLDREIATRAKADPVAKRLMTIPGVGPVVATALVALTPAASTFKRGRDFAAWLGLVPRQHSSGGKERLGRTTKMGERSLRRLLILGASSATKVAARNPDKAGAWLAGMLARKPRMLVTVALANKMARIVWALMAHGGSYRAPAAAV
jgi:transposase